MRRMTLCSVIKPITRSVAPQLLAFSISEIEKECPGVSRPTIRRVLERMRDEGAIEVKGKGRGARWHKRDS